MKLFQTSCAILFAVTFVACNTSSPAAESGQSHNADSMSNTGEHHQYTNRLIDETSPYLLQHAHNPVDWYPWGEEAFEKARTENKLILVSVGYSACHWCHVMERESFEDSTVAEYMNEHYVCIKVDREERPDVDDVYMTAVQLMTQRGGWPMNCFTLPDGRPIYGGTYYAKQDWMNLLGQLHTVYETEPEKVLEYAERLTEGIQQEGLVPKNVEATAFETAHNDQLVASWSKQFDSREGGPNRAPKFPIPNNYQYLLRYAHHTGDERIMEHVLLTLDKMAYGGIYDQVGGGFARYSVDYLWKVPHFEKMLYDNAQLVTLYSEAYQATNDEEYKDIVYETLAFIAREMTSEEGAFYSALDADSEGEEGKFYIWTKEEVEAMAGDQFPVVKDYYNIKQAGYWEEDNYILLRRDRDENIANKHNISVEELRTIIKAFDAKALEERSKRVRPGLDDKSLTSWNALMLKGYVDAYKVFGETAFLDAALKNAEFIVQKQWRKDGALNHSYKEGRSTINGYLEDYCFTIEAFVALYEATFNQEWLDRAKQLTDYTLSHFFDESSSMFFFTSDLDPALIARKKEVNDNVIPASNSSMAKALFQLGHYFDDAKYLDISNQMLKNVYEDMPRYGAGYSNWGQLLMHHLYPYYEVAVVGSEADQRWKEFNQNYLPNVLYVGSFQDSQLPLLELKMVDGQTTIYVCQNKTCQLPVTETNEALKQIK